MEQQETDSCVRYFFEDDVEEIGKRIGCVFENLYVHGGGCTYYALAGPTPRTGEDIVCAATVLVPCDPDTHGVASISKLTRTCVLEVKRGSNYHFMYAVMSAIDDADSEVVVETST